MSQILNLAASVIAVLILPAQWQNVTTKGVPLTPLGTPNYGAPAPKMPDGKTPDLSGIWDSVKIPCEQALKAVGAEAFGCLDAVFGIPPQFFNIGGKGEFPGKEELPLQPWAAELVKQRVADESKDSPTSHCLPLTGPRGWAEFQFEKIVQTPDSITILSEYMAQYRQIFLDGRPLPKDPEPTFKGYSVGHWEGDTLVVETIGFKDNLWLDDEGHPLTDQAKTIEKIRRVNYGNLEVELTVDDPKAYTKPWTVKFNLFLVINNELLDYICNENEKDRPHLVGK